MSGDGAILGMNFDNARGQSQPLLAVALPDDSSPMCYLNDP